VGHTDGCKDVQKEGTSRYETNFDDRGLGGRSLYPKVSLPVSTDHTYYQKRKQTKLVPQCNKVHHSPGPGPARTKSKKAWAFPQMRHGLHAVIIIWVLLDHIPIPSDLLFWNFPLRPLQAALVNKTTFYVAIETVSNTKVKLLAQICVHVDLGLWPSWASIREDLQSQLSKEIAQLNKYIHM
jgi:hypothetical protein